MSAGVATPSRSAERQENPDGHPSSQRTVHRLAVPRFKHVPLWQGGRPGEQSSPKRPPSGAHTPAPDSGPSLDLLAPEQS